MIKSQKVKSMKSRYLKNLDISRINHYFSSNKSFVLEVTFKELIVKECT